MKDEIKEILRYLRIENGHCSSELSYEETNLLLDYITNLQEENKNLKQINEEHRKINGELREDVEELKKRKTDYSAVQKVEVEKHELQDRINELEQINEEHRKINGELREENKRLSKDIKKTQYMLVEAHALCDEYIEKYNLLQGSDE